jgi:hypothetical protein
MAETVKPKMMGTCPLCFREQNDCAFLRFEKKTGRYYCVRCCFSGTREEVIEEFERIKSSYRLVSKRDETLLR